jgi:uncharacterized membrane protein YGL010W
MPGPEDEPMKALDEQLATYAAYHRNPWNRLTHVVGVPLVTFALLLLMAWVRVPIAGAAISGAVIFAAAVLAWYVLLDAVLGVTMAVVIAPFVYGAERVAALPLDTGLVVFGGTFVVGWVFQLAGHAIEGRRPAIVDNLLQALVAPLFLLAEAFFALGLRRDLRRRLEARRGAGGR